MLDQHGAGFHKEENTRPRKTGKQKAAYFAANFARRAALTFADHTLVIW
jgi:hypothetical protein